LLGLGDQPLVEPAAMKAVLAAAGERPFTAARSGPAGPPNPVLVARAAFRMATELEGDRGFGPLLAARPELVAEVDVPGDNRDVDTAADLAAVAERAWARQVARNREQVERFREAPDAPDFYAPTSQFFRADPDRRGDAVGEALVDLARPGETWLDVGAGAGRYALPLARKVRGVIAVDPSPAMLAALRESAAEHGIKNVRTIEARWPIEGAEGGSIQDAKGEPIEADVALIAHFGYDIESIGPFLDALEAAARRLCVAVMMERSPAAAVAPLWPAVHGEPRVHLPGLDAFVGLLQARSGRPEVRHLPGPTDRLRPWDALVTAARQQTWVAPGSAKDAAMLAALRELAVETNDGWTVPQPSAAIGVVTWRPSGDPA
jgi:SAM-dependent methyltransferase